MTRPDLLVEEINYLHKSLFNSAPHVSLVEDYVATHGSYSFTGSPEQNEAMKTVIQKRLDIYSLEFILRFLRPNNWLSKKVQIFSYLLELNSSSQMALRSFAPPPVSKIEFMRDLLGAFVGICKSLVLGIYAFVYLKFFLRKSL